MKTLIQSLPRLLRCRQGNVMLEFAIGSGVLVAAFAGIFQFGYTFYQYNLLKNSVTDGAHFGALATYDSSTATPSSSFQTAVQNMVVYGDPGGGSSPIARGLTTSNVSVTPNFTNGVPSSITVSITGYTIGAVFGTTTLNNKPSATFAYQGIYAPY